jgi:predicted ATPase/DNA-binding XRE family transcriptional regulator
MESTASFGYWVRRRRKALDLTQAALAQQAGCAVVTIRKIEADESRPSRQLAERLAACLALAPDERDGFLKAARAELAIHRLPLPAEPLAPVERPAPSSAAPPTGNLPLPATPLIGREQEVAELATRLGQEELRLLTLTGPGGTGKTRLALQVAADMRTRFADGVWFVNLAPISDPALVASSIAHVLGLNEINNTTLLDDLTEFLSSRQLLLLLDNMEQVIAAAPLISSLLAAAPGIQILITSRKPLRISGEHEFSVTPLALPEQQPSPDCDMLSDVPAVRLFIERARAIRADFALRPEQAAAVAAICIRLDGLPLAIELAAVWVKLFSPQELLRQLDYRLAFLTSGPRDLPLRQQTIYNTIDWSYTLLSPGEQILFSRLGVFVGGCTLAAVVGVCNADGRLPINVLEGLLGLLEQSLIRREGDEESRFTMLETIREYALEQLRQRGEEALIRRQHATYFLNLVNANSLPSSSPHFDTRPAMIAREHDNVRAALEWAFSGGDPMLGARLTAAFWRYWHNPLHWEEGRRWLDMALALFPTVPDGGDADPERLALHARLLTGGGALAMGADYATARVRLEASIALHRQLGDQRNLAQALTDLGGVAEHGFGDYATAYRLQAESVALFRKLGDQWSLAWTLLGLGGATLWLGRYDEARAIFAESAALFRTLDPPTVCWALSGLAGVAQNQGDYEGACALYEEALAMARHSGNDWYIRSHLHWLGSALAYKGEYQRAISLLEEGLLLARSVRHKSYAAEMLNMLGEVTMATGDSEQATRLFHESLDLNGQRSNRREEARSLHNLGRIALAQGDQRQASTHLATSLSLLQELGDSIGVIACLTSVACLATLQGEASTAAQLFGAVASQREATHTPPWKDLLYAATVQHYYALAQQQLSPPAWASAWAAGQAMTLSEAVAAAQERC